MPQVSLERAILGKAKDSGTETVRDAAYGMIGRTPGVDLGFVGDLLSRLRLKPLTGGEPALAYLGIHDDWAVFLQAYESPQAESGRGNFRQTEVFLLPRETYEKTGADPLPFLARLPKPAIYAEQTLDPLIVEFQPRPLEEQLAPLQQAGISAQFLQSFLSCLMWNKQTVLTNQFPKLDALVACLALLPPALRIHLTFATLSERAAPSFRLAALRTTTPPEEVAIVNFGKRDCRDPLKKKSKLVEALLAVWKNGDGLDPLGRLHRRDDGKWPVEAEPFDGVFKRMESRTERERRLDQLQGKSDVQSVCARLEACHEMLSQYPTDSEIRDRVLCSLFPLAFADEPCTASFLECMKLVGILSPPELNLLSERFLTSGPWKDLSAIRSWIERFQKWGAEAVTDAANPVDNFFQACVEGLLTPEGRPSGMTDDDYIVLVVYLMRGIGQDNLRERLRVRCLHEVQVRALTTWFARYCLCSLVRDTSNLAEIERRAALHGPLRAAPDSGAFLAYLRVLWRGEDLAGRAASALESCDIDAVAPFVGALWRVFQGRINEESVNRVLRDAVQIALDRIPDANRRSPLQELMAQLEQASVGFGDAPPLTDESACPEASMPRLGPVAEVVQEAYIGIGDLSDKLASALQQCHRKFKKGAEAQWGSALALLRRDERAVTPEILPSVFRLLIGKLPVAANDLARSYLEACRKHGTDMTPDLVMLSHLAHEVATYQSGKLESFCEVLLGHALDGTRDMDALLEIIPPILTSLHWANQLLSARKLLSVKLELAWQPRGAEEVVLLADLIEILSELSFRRQVEDLAVPKLPQEEQARYIAGRLRGLIDTIESTRFPTDDFVDKLTASAQRSTDMEGRAKQIEVLEELRDSLDGLLDTITRKRNAQGQPGVASRTSMAIDGLNQRLKKLKKGVDKGPYKGLLRWR